MESNVKTTLSVHIHATCGCRNGASDKSGAEVAGKHVERLGFIVLLYHVYKYAYGVGCRGVRRTFERISRYVFSP